MLPTGGPFFIELSTLQKYEHFLNYKHFYKKIMIQDDASCWFASQNQQIQDFEAPPVPEAEPLNTESDYDPDRPFGDAPTVTDEDVRNVTNMRLAQQPTAELIVGVMDVLMPLVLVLLIKGTDKDDIKLEPDERETLVTAWAGYLGDKNIQASPGVVLIIALVTVYGGKIVATVADRKKRDEISCLKAELEGQQASNAQLEQQLAIARKKEE